MEVALTFASFVLLGLFIGVFSGMLGIGGGTLTVPAFRLLYGMSAFASTATSLFLIVPTSLAGAIVRLRQKTCIIPLGIAAGIGGACTSSVGVWLSSISPAWMVMVVAAIVIAYSAISMFQKALKATPTTCHPERNCHPEAQPKDPAKQRIYGLSRRFLSKAPHNDILVIQPPSCHPERSRRIHLAPQDLSLVGEPPFPATRKNLAIAFGIGFAAGLIAGYVGLGGGFLMIPLMMIVLGLPMKQASGSSLLAMTILVVPGVISQAILGNIDYLVGMAVAIGSIPGATIGARLVKVVPERGLRFAFSGFLLLAAILLILRETFFCS